MAQLFGLRMRMPATSSVFVLSETAVGQVGALTDRLGAQVYQFGGQYWIGESLANKLTSMAINRAIYCRLFA